MTVLHHIRRLLRRTPAPAPAPARTPAADVIAALDAQRPGSVTADPADPRLGHGVDSAPAAQNDAYLVLHEDERAKGFVRPLRNAYKHVDGCGAVTTMSSPIAETYARDPGFYAATYCVGCLMHRPIAEFAWIGETGQPTSDRLGS